MENNPVGIALLGTCGALVLVAAALAFAWRGPGDVVADDKDAAASEASGPVVAGLVLGDEEQYQVINDRPLFNASRRPEVIEVIEGDDAEDVVEVVETEVANRPDVRLTGVVITPEARYVTLTPNQGGEPVVARVGTALEENYVGWSVDAIGARKVELASARGESFSLELSVYDNMIEAPPTPEPRPVPGLEPPPGEDVGDGEPPPPDGERLSRAEEIRQRIAERREQLRQEAEQKAEQDQEQRTEQRNDYREAMRAMMARGRDNQDSEQSDDQE